MGYGPLPKSPRFAGPPRGVVPETARARPGAGAGGDTGVPRPLGPGTPFPPRETPLSGGQPPLPTCLVGKGGVGNNSR